MPTLKKIPVSDGGDDVMCNPCASMYPPSFHAEEKQIPEIRKWKVGEKYVMIIEVEQKSMNEDQKDRLSASFDIVAYKCLPKKSIDKMTDKEFGEYQGKSMAKGELQ